MRAWEGGGGTYGPVGQENAYSRACEMGGKPVHDLRFLAFKLICDPARDERDATREVEFRRPSGDQALHAQIDRVARV